MAHPMEQFKATYKGKLRDHTHNHLAQEAVSEVRGSLSRQNVTLYLPDETGHPRLMQEHIEALENVNLEKAPTNEQLKPVYREVFNKAGLTDEALISAYFKLHNEIPVNLGLFPLAGYPVVRYGGMDWEIFSEFLSHPSPTIKMEPSSSGDGFSVRSTYTVTKLTPVGGRLVINRDEPDETLRLQEACRASSDKFKHINIEVELTETFQRRGNDPVYYTPKLKITAKDAFSQQVLDRARVTDASGYAQKTESSERVFLQRGYAGIEAAEKSVRRAKRWAPLVQFFKRIGNWFASISVPRAQHKPKGTAVALPQSTRPVLGSNTTQKPEDSNPGPEQAAAFSAQNPAAIPAQPTKDKIPAPRESDQPDPSPQIQKKKRRWFFRK